MDVSLRPVERKDIGTIYSWRNHPGVREGSFNPGEIRKDEHLEYWDERLAGKDYSFIVVGGGNDVGLLRLDGHGGCYEVHILIAPGFQRKGFGKAAIEEAKKLAKRIGAARLVAKVKPGNAPSHAMFRNSGFAERYSLYECDL